MGGKKKTTTKTTTKTKTKGETRLFSSGNTVNYYNTESPTTWTDTITSVGIGIAIGVTIMLSVGAMESTEEKDE